jgi:hypothetical protein
MDEVDTENANGKSKQSLNYTKSEGTTFGDGMGERISICGDQQRLEGKKYWQRIEDKFHRLMPKTKEPSSRIVRSFQGQYDVIKQCCSWWVRCLEQFRNTPPSGCLIDDYASFN